MNEKQNLKPILVPAEIHHKVRILALQKSAESGRLVTAGEIIETYLTKLKEFAA